MPRCPEHYDVRMFRQSNESWVHGRCFCTRRVPPPVRFQPAPAGTGPAPTTRLTEGARMQHVVCALALGADAQMP